MKLYAANSTLRRNASFFNESSVQLCLNARVSCENNAKNNPIASAMCPKALRSGEANPF